MTGLFIDNITSSCSGDSGGAYHRGTMRACATAADCSERAGTMPADVLGRKLTRKARGPEEALSNDYRPSLYALLFWISFPGARQRTITRYEPNENEPNTLERAPTRAYTTIHRTLDDCVHCAAGAYFCCENHRCRRRANQTLRYDFILPRVPTPWRHDKISCIRFATS